MEYRNSFYINAENSRIDMEIEHPRHGWIPITITELEYPELWAEVVASGNVAPYAPPETE